MKTKRVHHVKLSVISLEVSRKFYQKLPNFKVVADHEDFVMFYNGSFYLGLTSHKGEVKGRFNEKMVGMDHLGIEVESKEDLEEALKFLDREQVPHGKIEKLSNEVQVLAFRDPDNIQLEFCWNGK